MSYHIYGIGNALVDKEYEVDDAFLSMHGIEKGQMTLIDENQLQARLIQLENDYPLKKRASGGSAANSVIAASYFGANTFYSCNVGDDDAGEFYVKDLLAADVQTNMRDQRSKGVTGHCLVMVTPDAERTMNTYLGITSDLDDRCINQDAITESQWVYLEGYLVTSDSSRAAAIKVRQLAESNQIQTAMTFSDPSMVQFFKDGLKEMLADGVDLLFCNEQEAKLFSDVDDLDQAINNLKPYANILVITLGSKGAKVITSDATYDIEPVATTAVDTNGAGDMFAGAFMYALTQNYDYERAARFANAAASKVVSQFGPRLQPQQHDELKQWLDKP